MQHKHAVIFSASRGTLGLRSLAAPNHVFCVTQLNDGAVIIDPAVSRIFFETRKIDADQILNSKSAVIKKALLKVEDYSAALLRKSFFPKNETLKASDQEISKEAQEKADEIFDPRDLRREDLIAKLKTQIALDYYFYKLIRTVVKVINPIAIYEINLIRDAILDRDRHGMPMFCHNVISSFIGVEVGNPICMIDFKVKLKLLSGVSNFISYRLHERDLTPDELKLGRLR